MKSAWGRDLAFKYFLLGVLAVNLFIFASGLELAFYFSAINRYLSAENTIFFDGFGRVIYAHNYYHFSKTFLVFKLLGSLLLTIYIWVKIAENNIKFRINTLGILALIIYCLFLIYVLRNFPLSVEKALKLYGETGNYYQALFRFYGKYYLLSVLALLCYCIFKYRNIFDQIFNKILLIAFLLAAIIAGNLVIQELSSDFTLLKENLNPKISLTKIYSDHINEVLRKQQPDELLKKNYDKVNSDNIFEIVFNPIYDNEDLGIHSVINKINLSSINKFSLKDKLDLFKNKIIQRGDIAGGILYPIINNNTLMYRLDNKNIYNICFIFDLYKDLPATDSFKSVYDLNMNYISIDKCIESIDSDGVQGVLNSRDRILIAQTVKQDVFNHVQWQVDRDRLSSFLVKSLNIGIYNNGPLIEVAQSFALGYKIHHIQNFIQPIYRSGGSYISLLMNPGQYGFGPVAVSKLLSKSMSPLDLSLNPMFLVDVFFLLAFILLFLVARVMGLENYQSFSLIGIFGLILIYISGSYYAPALHYIRAIPQILILFLFIGSRGFLNRHIEYFAILLISFSWIYNLEFGIFYIFSFIFSILISSRFDIKCYLTENKFKFVSILIGILLLVIYIIFKDKVPSRTFEYLFGISMGVSPFNYFNFLVLIFSVIPVIYLLINFSKERLYFWNLFFTVSAMLISMKFHWNTSFNHLAIVLPFIGFSYSILYAETVNFLGKKYRIFKWLSISFIGFIIYVIAINLPLHDARKAQDLSVRTQLNLYPAEFLGKNAFTTLDNIKLKNDLEAVFYDDSNRYPVISFQDSLLSLALREPVLSYYDDFATNTVYLRDINLAVEYLQKNHRCIILDKSLFYSDLAKIPTFPTPIEIFSFDVSNISKQRNALSKLAEYLKNNIYKKQVFENNSFVKMCN